jgi:alkaline phosphatase D
MSNGLAWILALLSMSVSAQVLPTLSPETNITRLAFGSCNDQRDDQPLWKDMLAMKPDLFIWGGDAIYADWDDKYDIARSYQKQLAVPAYQEVRREIPILGTWDDHDYGFDNADGTFTQKVNSKNTCS